MSDVLDGLQCLQLLIGQRRSGRFTGTATDELDGLEDAASRLTLPNLPKTAAAERFDQPIAGNGFLARLPLGSGNELRAIHLRSTVHLFLPSLSTIPRPVS